MQNRKKVEHDLIKPISKKDMELLKEVVFEERQKGNVVIATFEGLKTANLSEFIKQHDSGILYDLNRCEAVALTDLSNPRWINDYATAQVIRELKSRITELENKLNKESL